MLNQLRKTKLNINLPKISFQHDLFWVSRPILKEISHAATSKPPSVDFGRQSPKQLFEN